MITTYPHAKAFLQAHDSHLAKEELRHNMIIGNCNNLLQDPAASSNHHFISAGQTHAHALSMRVSPKAIIASLYHNEDAVHAIADFYQKEGAELSGVIGDEFATDVFIEKYPAHIRSSRFTLIQAVENCKTLTLARGTFGPAGMRAKDELIQYGISFMKEESLSPLRSPEEMDAYITKLINQQELFTLSNGVEILAMAAIIRKTPSSAIIGFVYTPPEHRGRGYGLSCTHRLSTHIHAAGFRHSGLLVYEKNFAARRTYERIGYHTIARLQDVDFTNWNGD